MGRPRAFDPEEALEAAMHVFWTHGYDATSLQDLLEAMGISKSSFYDTFGSKHDLFLATMAHYSGTLIENGMAALEKASSPRAYIADAFHGVVESAVAGDRRGCFISNCAMELAPHDPLAAKQIALTVRRVEEGFYTAVCRGQAAGEFPADRDARALARYLTGAINGLRVMAKANPDRAVLEDVARVSLEALG